MVRATIACSFCRKSKIKCIHDGTSPCRNCLKSGRVELGVCVLSAPYTTTYRSVHRRKEQRVQARHGAVESPQIQISPEPAIQNDIADRLFVTTENCPIQQHLENTPAAVLLQAASVFSCKFPEFAFLHLPNLSSKCRSPLSSQLLDLLCAILALCARFLRDASGRQIEGLLSDEQYANYLRTSIPQRLMDPPSIENVQTLILSSMYEWGSGNGYRAWMYSGIATRMIQSLEALQRDKFFDGSISESWNRTYWSVFVLDRMVFCGISQPRALPLSRMNIPFPVGEQNFAFGNTSEPRLWPLEMKNGSLPAETQYDIDHYYSCLTTGFDIWSRVLEFILRGGRRQPEMLLQQNFPWVTDSPWDMMYQDLKMWRNQQSERLKYSRGFIAAHSSLGNGERAAFINLIYYASIMFLHREYIPFLPAMRMTPRGPIDPPLFPQTPPEGWWEDGARDIFQAAACITNILQELEESGTSLKTPFTGFCAFSAATMNIYVSSFPSMNLGRSENTMELLEMNVAYLKSFKSIWALGEGWYKTMEHIKNLFERLVANRAEFQGKTRNDFIALEASLHDYTGVTPLRDESISLPTESNSSNPRNEHATAIGIQEVATENSDQVLSQNQQPITEDALDDSWNWPFWGGELLMPFAVGGTAFEESPVYHHLD